MRSKLLFLIFLLGILAGRISIAEDKKPEFQAISAGEVAPFDGFLLNPEALVQIYITTEEDLKKQKLEFDHKLDLANVELERVKKLNDSEKVIHTNLLSNTVRIKDDIIQAKEQKIKALENKDLLNKFIVIGSFIAGVVCTYGIFYISTGLAK